MRIALSTLLAIGGLGLLEGARAQTAGITVDMAQPGARIDARLYGIFLEEINHGVDGGLYAELIANRAFESSRPPEGFTMKGGRWKDARGYDSGFEVEPGTIPHWTRLAETGAEGTMRLEASGGLTEASPACLRLDLPRPAGRVAVANDGYWGIGLKSGATYVLALHARAEGPFRGGLSVRLEDGTGQPCSDTVRFKGVGSAWQRFDGRLTARRAEPKARLVIRAEGAGPLWLDFVSLMPRETWKGHGLRPDLAQMIADLKPGFVRFPGGCVVEGGTVETAYDWKLTVGRVEERREQWSAWNVRRTHGLGFHEYLQFCEDLGAAPLHVGFAGQTCLFREAENVPMNAMGWVLTNFLDAIEYANGAPSTPWGAMRAKAGHPAPFGLKLVEIGNENGTPEFPPRYRYVYDGLKARHPDITTIADLSWIGRDLMRDCRFDIEDNHFYNSPQWFLNAFDQYDRRDRKLPPVYVGEVAVTSGDGGDLKGNLIAALAEGVFLMGCERNGDVVKMVSYAPLLAHVDGRSGWHGMIYHDSTRAFGTVSYQLWKLFGQHRPDHALRTAVQFTPAVEPPILGRVGVGTWDTSAEFKDLRVEKEGRVLLEGFGPGTQWQPDGGNWSLADGAWRQADQAVGLSRAGDEAWSDYTLTVKARKLGGGEGFLLAFGQAGGDGFWWNVGGWGNREHGVEFNRSPAGRRVPGHIETGRWYELKVELHGRQIRCSLDGQLVHELTAPSASRFFAVAGRDEAAGETVLKVVNTSATPVRATVTLQGARQVEPKARLITLSSDRLDDNNSFEQPQKVAPVSRTVSVPGTAFEQEFPARSFSILRVGTR